MSAVDFPSWASLPLSPARVVVASAAVLAGVAVWAGTLVRQRRRPAVPVWMLVAIGALLSWGAWLVVNAHTRYDERSARLSPGTPLASWLPGGADRAIGAVTWLQTAAVMLGGLALSDLARRARVRTALLWVLASAGAIVGWLGTLDRLGRGPLRFRQLPTSGTHFALFEYHANAAAFENLALPAALVLAARAWRPPARNPAHVATIAVVVAGVFAGCAAHVSKAGQVLTAITLLGALVLARRRAVTRVRFGSVLLAIAATVAIAAGALGASGRWRALPASLRADNPRLLMTRVALAQVARAPFAGSGPGSYKLLVPATTADRLPALYAHWIVQTYERGEPTTVWMHAYDDALQTLVEWGAAGLVAAVAVFVAPLWYGIRAVRRRRGGDADAIAAGVIALAVVGLHSLVDFPLQVLPIQLAAAAWGAVVLGATRSADEPQVRPTVSARRKSSTARHSRSATAASAGASIAS